jgi:hypothetical protein
MHTLAKNIEHNSRLIYDFIDKAYPDGIPDFHTLVKDNIINGTQLLELAVNKVDNIGMCEIGYHRDLIDDSDVKTLTVQKSYTRKKRKLKSGLLRSYKSLSYVAKIKKVDKKLGVLRVICWNPFAQRYHYFKIPPSLIYGLKCVTVTFDSNTFLPTGKYAECEVETFEEMASKLGIQEKIDTILCNIDKGNIMSQIQNIISIIKD